MKIESVPVVKSYSVRSRLRMAKGVKTALNCEVFWFYPFVLFHELLIDTREGSVYQRSYPYELHMNEATLI